MLKFIKSKKYELSLIILLLIVIEYGLKQISLPMIAEGDAYSRALVGRQMAANNILFRLAVTNVWLPLHFTIINIPHWFGVDLFFGQRLATLIISSLGIIAIYLYTLEFFSNKNIAFLTSLLFAVFPLRLFLAAQTLSESVFITFFILFVYFLIKKKKSSRDLFLLVMLNFICGMTRFESWFFLPIALISLIMDKKISTSIKINLFVAMTVPSVLWILKNGNQSGQSFSFFQEKYAMAQKELNLRYFNFEKTWLD